MSKPKIIFIINSIQQQRCIKRINEFLDNGYEIEAYGFNRSSVVPTQPERFSIHVLDTFDASVGYVERMVRMLRVLRPLFRRYKEQNAVYYYFLLDVAIACRILCKRPYIYEESDLMQTEIRNGLVCRLLNTMDRHIIRHSLLTVQTSEGFGQYLFGSRVPPQLITVPNKLNADVLNLPYTPHPVDVRHLRFAFVGDARYGSTLRFAQAVAEHFPQYSFHFYGLIQHREEEVKALCDRYANVLYHGPFANPKDLPSVYSQIDILVSTYDIAVDNVKYAEPNKLYEACYFEVPIVVTSGTYLSQKVDRWGIGYAIDGGSDAAIQSFIQNLTPASLAVKQEACHAIPKEQLINNNPQLYKLLAEKLKY